MSDYNSSYKKSRSRKAIELSEILLRMTDSINRLEEIIMTSQDENKIINASNALSGIASRISKIYQAHDLEKRIKELEEKFELRKVS
jgi:hypothetical protein